MISLKGDRLPWPQSLLLVLALSLSLWGILYEIVDKLSRYIFF